MEITMFWLLILSGGYLIVAVKIASSIFVNQPNATKPKSSETQFKFQFELSLAQLSPSLFFWKIIISKKKKKIVTPGRLYQSHQNALPVPLIQDFDFVFESIGSWDTLQIFIPFPIPTCPS